MTITVGTNTYVTVVEADAYITEHFVSTDAQLVAWNLLSDGDKEIYLRNATRAMERLFITGRKYADSQDLAFPREHAQPWPNRRWEGSELTANLTLGETYDPAYSPYYIGDANIPDAVKWAQIEEALELASPSFSTTRFDQMKGSVSSVKIGHFAEDYNTRNKAGNSPQTVLRSENAQEYMQPFVGGGFRVV